MDATLQSMADSASNKNGVPTAIFSALVNRESGWNTNAVGAAGEIGLTQLNPNTWPSLGVSNPYDPAENLNAGAGYLKQMFNRFGNWYDALRGYNAGAGGATSSTSLGADYASAILSAANTSPTGETMTTPNSGNWITNNPLTNFFSNIGGAAISAVGGTPATPVAASTGAPSFFVDPVGYLKETFAGSLWAILSIIVIAALVWFGFQQMIKE